MLGEFAGVGSQKEPEPGSHDPESPFQSPTGPTKAGEATVAGKLQKTASFQEASYLRSTRADIDYLSESVRQELEEGNLAKASGDVETAKRRKKNAEEIYTRLKQIVGFHKDDRRANDRICGMVDTMTREVQPANPDLNPSPLMETLWSGSIGTPAIQP